MKAHYSGELPSLEMPRLDAFLACLFPSDNYIQKSPPGRKFPIERYPQTIRPENIEVHLGDWSFLACPDAPASYVDPKDRVVHIDCIVVSISIVFMEEPGKNPTSALGIFYGNNNPQNALFRPEKTILTEEASTLVAYLFVLREFQNLMSAWSMVRKNCPLHTLCIKCDSEFLVKGVTEWIPKWKENGWKNSKGKPVANSRIWDLIDEALIKLESIFNVHFWLVNEELNANARLLAHTGLRTEAESMSSVE